MVIRDGAYFVELSHVTLDCLSFDGHTNTYDKANTPLGYKFAENNAYCLPYST